MKWSDYESLLKISDIEYEVSEEYSDSVEEGNIISTDPANVAIAAASVSGQKGQRSVVSKGVRQADGSRRYSRRDQRIRQGSNQRTEEGWIR
mgnify:CR=1 FL=1